ncbi:UDP-glucuronosyltransferase 3A1-like [Platysternon megacephalum]|uniref:UDP-glucuronosyltransferase 3A1-like n=1 Tax=Platysternon megacephalum TaxID=55544 RepID=A0A4D9EPA5_9SAUR|nr:UDP-glucuronosyltransferase 3A1-like [Platysternon megacephalum]
MRPGVLSPCLLLLWVWALPAGSVLPSELSKTEVTQMFKDFMIQFNRTYRSPAEQRRRFGIFTRSLLVAEQLQETELGTGQYGVTRFSDWTDEEFRGVFWSPLPPTMHQAPRLPRKKPPPSCDWRKAGAVTAVKNQGEECRACWAFAAVANIESLWKIHFHQPRNLSVQEVLDCSWCGAGCEGGYVWDAFTTVLHKRGLTSEDAYPYTGTQKPCRNLNEYEPAAYIQGFQTLPGDEEEIAAHVASTGPITVTLNSAAMKYYKKGISQPLVRSCSPDHVDHVVLLVGYGEDVNKRRYWVIKNSWGKGWGEKGYYRLYRGRNACGITTFPVTATVNRVGAPRHKVHCPP